MTNGFADKIRAMFDTIAPTYDKLNRINTFGLDLQWRKDLVSQVAMDKPKQILDLAAGTGDLSIMLAKACPEATVIAGDMSIGMLEIARKKAHEEQLTQIQIKEMDAMNLPYEEPTFDAITCAFGIRNFESIAHSYREMYRVVRPGGMIAILELCEPKGSIIHKLYDVHVNVTMPTLASAVGHNKWAYEYLARSIEEVPQREEMTRLMKMAGFINTYHKVYFPYVCALYVGYKPLHSETNVVLSDIEKKKREELWKK